MSMTPLEAIEFMNKGSIVVTDVLGSKVCYKMEDDKLKYLNKENTWSEAKYFPFDKTFKLLLTGWERVRFNHKVFYCDYNGEVEDYTKYNEVDEDELRNIANSFSTKEKAEEINFKQTLFRKLQRFSDENGSNEIKWDGCSDKTIIIYDTYSQEVLTTNVMTMKDFGQVHFASPEVAQKAIELFHDDLVKYFTM